METTRLNNNYGYLSPFSLNADELHKRCLLQPSSSSEAKESDGTLDEQSTSIFHKSITNNPQNSIAISVKPKSRCQDNIYPPTSSSGADSDYADLRDDPSTDNRTIYLTDDAKTKPPLYKHTSYHETKSISTMIDRISCKSFNPTEDKQESMGEVKEIETRKYSQQPLPVESTETKSRIVVCVRKRPRNTKEIVNGDIDILNIPSKDHIVLCEPRQRFDLTEYTEHSVFRFDHCFDETCSTRQVYEHTAAPLVESIFQGCMATCFAYGQTGSGKTYTMSGPRSIKNDSPMVESGIYGMVVKDVFEEYTKYNRSVDFTISVNFFEIYGNKVHDLLNQKRVLRVLEDSSGSIQLLGLREYCVSDAQTALALLKNGYQLRTNGHTLANEHSSRSHAIFQVSDS